MSPRPQKVSDDDVFLAASRAMSRLGPGELTLTAIAEEAGVTAGLLVQRFGSKRALLLALSERFSKGSGDLFAQLRSGHRSALSVLRGYSDCMANLASSPAALVRNFAYLQIDLTDADFRRHLAKQAHATRVELTKLIREGVAAGEFIPDTRPADLARTIEAIVTGSMMSWAFYQKGPVAKWMRRHLDAILKPYLT